MKQGFLIPVYRHGIPACSLVKKLVVHNLPIIIIDDGNNKDTKKLLAETFAGIPGTFLINLEKNLGKGGAFIKGLEKAAELKLTHVLQIDADGQHDSERVPFFLEEAIKNPGKIICGFPEFEHNAPKSRVMGRKISNFWGAITTLSFELKDLLCGFRVYPVDKTLHIAKNCFLDKRMGFDPEILVRLYWSRVFPVFSPIKVFYPEDNFSNFRMVQDNLHISFTFFRLFCGMLMRLPLLLFYNIKNRKHE